MRLHAALLFAPALMACGVDIAQTAVLPGDPPIGCTSPMLTPSLPSDPALGGEDQVLPWDQAAGDYGVGQGPGVVVAARDAFRLYANAHLIAESTSPLVPEFVPLTLLPGDNVIAVLVSAAGGTPAALVQLDELERSYVSDTSWRVSDAPTSGWWSVDYDDSAWDAAADLGLPTPNCQPTAGFPAGSVARWIGAGDASTATIALRLSVRIAPIGFGADTTGGQGATPVLAQSWDEVAALVEQDDDPAVVLLPEGVTDFRPTGSDVTLEQACPTPCADGSGGTTYDLLPLGSACPVETVERPRNDRHLRFASNKTLVGLGRGAQLRGAWLDLGASQNVILRNIALYDVNPDLIEAGDAIGLAGAERVWVDHATFKWISDGFIDVTTGSADATFSWLRYQGQNDAACGGRHPRANELEDATATFHHTLWEHVDGRAPLVTHPSGRVHLFNNVVSDDPSYAVGVGCSGQVLLEGSTFENVRFPTAKVACSDGLPGAGLIDAPAGSNVYGDGVGPHQDDGVDAAEPHDEVFVPPYAYELEAAADAAFAVRERAGAGGRWALPIAPP